MPSIVTEVVRSIADEDAHIESVNLRPTKDAIMQLAGRLMLMSMENPDMLKPDALGDTPLEKSFIMLRLKIELPEHVKNGATAFIRGAKEGARKIGALPIDGNIEFKQSASVEELKEIMQQLGCGDVLKRIIGDSRIMAAHLLRMAELLHGKA